MANEGTYVCLLDGATLAKAKEELNEDDQQRASQIQALREWAKSQPHLNSRTDDEFLLRFLRAGKFSQLKAQERLDNFWTIRTVPGKGVPEWFQDMDPTDIATQEILDLGVMVPLPGRDDENRKVILIRTGAYDPKEHSLADILKNGMMSQDVLQMTEENIIHGYVLFQDFTEFSMGHVYHWDRHAISNSSRCWQDVYPSRNKVVHFYNTPTVFNAIYEVFKLFMKEKMQRRVVFHKGDLDSVLKSIPKRILPEEYGGDAGPLKTLIENWKQTVIENKAEFDLNKKYGVDESKRPLPATTGNTGGILGSFRKLNIE